MLEHDEIRAAAPKSVDCSIAMNPHFITLQRDDYGRDPAIIEQELDYTV